MARGVSIRAFSRENAKVSLSLSLPRLLNCKFPASVVPLAGVYICCNSRLLGCWFLRSCLQYYYPPLKVWDHPSAYLSGTLSFSYSFFGIMPSCVPGKAPGGGIITGHDGIERKDSSLEKEREMRTRADRF